HLDRFLVKLQCNWTGEACELTLFYDSRLFESRDAERFVEYYVRLLEGVLLNPAAPVGSHEILSADERRHLVVSLNQTAEDYPRDATVHELFELQAERAPDRPALVCRDRRQSFGDLNADANRLAHYLRGCGVGPGVRVGLCMDRSDEMIVGVL